MSEARGAMEEMIERLGQSHFGIIRAEVYEIVNRTPEEGGGPGTTGLSVRVIDGEALVTDVDEDSPAHELGVRTGWQIVRIGGKKIAPILEKVGEAYEGKLERDHELAKAVSKRLTEPVGEIVEVGFLDGDDKPINLKIETVEPKGNKIGVGNLPAQYVRFESRELDGGIGYMSLNVFLDPIRVMNGFGEAVESFIDAKGIVLDLRGNPGGIGAMGMGMAGWFVRDETKYLGVQTMRRGELKFVVNPRLKVYDGPVAVLVDGLSASTSEILAGGMKDIGRARIFGSTTAGAALPSMIDKLPNGDGFQYAIANYVSAGGMELEGHGVIPDEPVALTRASLLEGRDLVLEAAVRWIEKQP
jgi:carboxyl-terminal processing protease